MSILRYLTLVGIQLFALTAYADTDFEQKLNSKFPGTEGAKIAPAFAGFYSVVKGNEVLFVRDDLSVLINGDVIDLATNKSLGSQLREANKPKINVADLNLKDAIKIGNGSRKLYVFSDPDCPFCHQLEDELVRVKDVTIYVFEFPLESLHPNARKMAENIWCSKDKGQAWRDYLRNNTQPADAKCDNPIARNIEIAQKFQILGTPALIFEDGTLVPGAIPADRIEGQLAAARVK